MTHELWFGHPRKEIDLPICKRCEMPIDLQEWLQRDCPVRERDPLIAYAEMLAAR
jgi:hypothetical protein